VGWRGYLTVARFRFAYNDNDNDNFIDKRSRRAKIKKYSTKKWKDTKYKSIWPSDS